MADLVQATVDAILRHLSDLGSAKLPPEYSYHSLPLCVIDSVFSIGVKYANARKAVVSWCASQEPPWIEFRTSHEPRCTISDFIQLTEDLDGATLSARYFGTNQQRTSSRNGILKAEAVVRYAEALLRAGINDFPDVDDPDRVDAARRLVEAVQGHASGISFDYFLMLAGKDGFVKADRMICRFVSEAGGLPSIQAKDARDVVAAACRMLKSSHQNLTPRLLDFLIWEYQRRQARVRPDGLTTEPTRRTRRNAGCGN